MQQVKETETIVVWAIGVVLAQETVVEEAEGTVAMQAWATAVEEAEGFVAMLAQAAPTEEAEETVAVEAQAIPTTAVTEVTRTTVVEAAGTHAAANAQQAFTGMGTNAVTAMITNA